MDVDVAGGVAAALDTEVTATRPLTGGDIATSALLTLADGRRVVAKTLPDAPSGFFEAEARGLRWLVVPGGVPVPAVLSAAPDLLILDDVPLGAPTSAGAAQFGTRLAATHAAGAESFGGPEPAFIGSLAMPNTPHEAWAEFFAAERIRPFARAARDAGSLTAADARIIEAVAGRLGELVPAEPPARLHGDLWNGNLVWDRAGQAHLIDPAAHGGHRESDLAMLALFGAPHLDGILAAYDQAAPLAAGWRERVAVHQLFPLLAHAVLFGGGYGARAASGVAHLA